MEYSTAAVDTTPLHTVPWCGWCRFYVAEEGAARGECRRHAPQLIATPTGAVRSAWPVTPRTGWCGDWGTRP